MSNPATGFNVHFADMVNSQPDDDGDGIEKINVDVNLPSVLRTRVFKNEETVNLLKIATVIFNNDLESDPKRGFGKIIFFLKDEKFEYNFRIHAIYFNPTLDLDDMSVTARISTTDNRMVDRLVKDKVIEFYLSGKMTQIDSGEIDTVVITKVTANIDQTAYAKRYKQYEEKKKKLLNLPDEMVNEDRWKADAIKIEGVAQAWKDFRNKQKKEEKEPPKSHFEAWRERFKTLNKKVDSFVKP